MVTVPLVELTGNGLYCPQGDFYIDPWASVDRAVITHAHRAPAPGSRPLVPGWFLAAKSSERLLRARLGADAAIEFLEYATPVTIGSVRVSLHPAGHILGSAQVRIECAGEVWVVSGHYKLVPDPTCAPFELLRCHTFVTEATYGLPIFRWPSDTAIRGAIHEWWRANQHAGRVSLLHAHPVGKAQRLLALVDPSIGPIYCHEAVEAINEIYRGQGIELPPTARVEDDERGRHSALVLAPSSAHGSEWARHFGPASTALASGWMRIRGTRRRRSLDRGFVFSNHADWSALLRVIQETHAENVWVTGEFRGPVARWIEEHGGQALALEGRWEEAEP
jgi:putative mRNA 3-end processing factor